jgi:hypothetical protein
MPLSHFIFNYVVSKFYVTVTTKTQSAVHAKNNIPFDVYSSAKSETTELVS